MRSQAPKDILKFSGNPDFIEGIYNYCDSWCERCAFTNRCMNYAMRKNEQNTTTESQLSEVFKQTTEIIKQLIQEKGLDWEEMMKEVEAETPVIDPHEAAENHFIVKEALLYTDMYRSFLKSEQRYMQSKGLEFQNELNKGIISIDEAEKSVFQLDDAFEVANWYQSIIYIKIRNACQLFFEENLSDFMKDFYNGKAKLTLISIDRSIAAWFVLQVHFPEKADKITEILTQLEKLRRYIEEDFPNARKFVRPGLDQ